MDKLNIALFAGSFLDSKGYVTAVDLQQYIRNNDNSGAIVPIETIEEVLENLTLVNWLHLVCGTDIYKRYVDIKRRYEKYNNQNNRIYTQ